jgi:condensin complex subunit 2
VILTFVCRPSLQNITANINMHKLDATFDIDPLFHKMSKTFDEGGAKGLLLANLGVSATGCYIVFDSTLDVKERKRPRGSRRSWRGRLTSLTAKLKSTLGGQTVQQLSLVPQLAFLRSEFAQLQQDGFVDNFVQ